jgi:biopolymer transport protein ExbB
MLGVKIRENPGPGEYRYIRFAWRKQGGNSICLQLNHDGNWGPGGEGAREGAKFRYHAGPGGECFGASLTIDEKLPAPRFVVVTRDLFADFGEFTLTGLAFSPVDGQAALFDHLYLARQPEDFTLLKVEK